MLKPIANRSLRFDDVQDVINKINNHVIYEVYNSNDEINIYAWDVINVTKSVSPNTVEITYQIKGEDQVNTMEFILDSNKLQGLCLFKNKLDATEYATDLANELSKIYHNFSVQFESELKQLSIKPRKTFLDIKAGDKIACIYPNGDVEKTAVKFIENDTILDLTSFVFDGGEFLPIRRDDLFESSCTINNVLYTPIDE